MRLCIPSGGKKTTLKNLVGQSNQRKVARDRRFRGFQLLSTTGCSKYVMPFACSIFAPVCLEKYGMLPPCRSLCVRVKSACQVFLDMAVSMRSDLDCNFFPNPGNATGCIDWSMRNGYFELTIRGEPTMDQWKNRKMPDFYQ